MSWLRGRLAELSLALVRGISAKGIRAGDSHGRFIEDGWFSRRREEVHGGA